MSEERVISLSAAMGKVHKEVCECAQDNSLIYDYGRIRLCLICGQAYSEMKYQAAKNRIPSCSAEYLGEKYKLADGSFVLVTK